MAAKSRCLRQRKGGSIAGHRAGLDERGALPILSGALVVIESRLDRNRRRRRGRVRSQPQIGAKDVAIGGALVENTDEFAGQAGEALLNRGAAAIAHAFRVVQQNEVDIARIIQFAGAELAHAEDDKPAIVLDLAAQPQLDLAGAGGVAEQVADGDGEGGIGEIAERRGDAVERPSSGNIGEADEQRCAALGDAQLGHDGRGVRRAVAVAAPALSVERVDQFGESGVGPPLQQRAEESDFPQAAMREERRIAEHRLEQCPAGSVLGQRAGESGEVGTTVIGLGPSFEAAHRLRGIGRGREIRRACSIGEQR
jgi:hypothetical protein